MNKDIRHERSLSQIFQGQLSNNKQNVNILNNSYSPLDGDDESSNKNYRRPIKLNFNLGNQISSCKNESKNEQKKINTMISNSQVSIMVKENLITEQNTLQYSSVHISQNKYSVLSEVIDNSLIEPYNQFENLETRTNINYDIISLSNQNKIYLSGSLASINEQKNQLYPPIKKYSKQYCFQCDMKTFQIKKILLKEQQERDQKHRIQKTILKRQYQQKYHQFWTKMVQKQTLILNLSNQNINYKEQIKELKKQLDDLRRTIQNKDKEKQKQIQDLINRYKKQHQQRIKTLQQKHQNQLINLKTQIKTKQKQYEALILIREQQNESKIREMKHELDIQLLNMKSRLRDHFEKRQKIIFAKLSADYEQRIRERQIYAQGLQEQINDAKLLVKYKNQMYEKQIQLLINNQLNFYTQAIQSNSHKMQSDSSKTQDTQKPQNKVKLYSQFVQLTLQSYRNILALDNQTKTHSIIQLNQKIQTIKRFHQLKQEILLEKIRQIQQANQQLQNKLIQKYYRQHNSKNDLIFSRENYNNNSQIFVKSNQYEKENLFQHNQFSTRQQHQSDTIKQHQIANHYRQDLIHKLQITQKQVMLKTKQLKIKQNQLSIYQNTILSLQEKNQQQQKQINRLSQLLKMKQQQLDVINYNQELQTKQIAIQTQAIQVQNSYQMQQNSFVQQKVQAQYQLKHQQLKYQLQQCQIELNKYKNLYQGQYKLYQEQKDSYFKHINQFYGQKKDLIQKIQLECSIQTQRLLQTQQKMNQQTIRKLNLSHEKLVDCFKQQIVQLSSIVQGVISVNHNLNRKIQDAHKDFQELQRQFKHLITFSLINLTTQQ